MTEIRYAEEKDREFKTGIVPQSMIQKKSFTKRANGTSFTKEKIVMISISIRQRMNRLRLRI